MSVCPCHKLGTVAQRGIFVYSQGHSDAVMANEMFRIVWAPTITPKLVLHYLLQVPLSEKVTNAIS